jgi:outer membrane immunogenic protein
MKKIVLATVLAALGSASALAADLPARGIYTKAPAYEAVSNWTGFYVGGNAGYSWMNGTDKISGPLIGDGIIPASVPVAPHGFIGGGQLGYNWQISPRWVVGVEADMSWTDMEKTSAVAGSDLTRIMTAHEKLDWLGTARARVGFIPADHILVYGTGGLAYGHVGLSTALTTVRLDGTLNCTGNNCENGSTSDTKVGWTIGAGTEWAFTNNWSLKAEYLHYDLGTVSHIMTDPNFPAAVLNAASDTKGNIVRAGVNYHFN